ncbi:MAG: hypothetical protein CMO34_03520 [Verrucomicrobia bacterium]|nr:hypothetical protein [Verrucomicrobiota bacterium]
MTVSCQTDQKDNNEPDNQYYIEKSLSFFDPYDNDYTYSTWIRKPENIRTAHETFKKIGYYNLLDSSELYQNPCMLWGYVDRPCNEIMDSLLITYPLDTIKPKYYREFWDRRRNENNDKVVFEILSEIHGILFKDSASEYNKNIVNDTLFKLVEIDRVRTNPTENQAKKDFDFLKNIGLHLSAYNVLNEKHTYQKVEWNKDELEKQLKTDTTNCCPTPWIKDDTK